MRRVVQSIIAAAIMSALRRQVSGSRQIFTF
jgi:hypothetical protein